eukprot:11183200-Lingulodinium_polyedra.AAC.1
MREKCCAEELGIGISAHTLVMDRCSRWHLEIGIFTVRKDGFFQMELESGIRGTAYKQPNCVGTRPRTCA